MKPNRHANAAVASAVAEALEPRRMLAAEVLVSGHSQLRTYPMASDGTWAYFSSHVGGVDQDAEIWRTDGTIPGTTKLGVVPGAAAAAVESKLPRDALLINDKLFFLAGETESNGIELFVADPALNQVQKLSNFAASGSYVAARDLVQLNGKAYVIGYNAASGYELYSSDGTLAGTQLVMDLVPGAADGTANVSRVGDELYLSAYTAPGEWSIYRSDGTAGGTQLLTMIPSGFATSVADDFIRGPREFVALNNGRVVFSAYQMIDSTTRDRLWSTDGTAAGTQSLNQLGGVSFVSAGDFAVYLEGQLVPGGERSVYLTDGTIAGTQKLPTNIKGWTGETYLPFAHGGAIYLNNSVQGHSGLYRITPTSTTRLTEESATDLTAVGDKVYFSGGYWPWVASGVGVTDGTVQGTQLLTSHGNSPPFNLVPVADGVVYGSGAKLQKMLYTQQRLPGLSGQFFQDDNGNGVRDAGEPYNPNISEMPFMTVAADGTFDLKWLPPDVPFTIQTAAPEWMRPTTPTSRTFTLAEGEVVTGADFGWQKINIIKGFVRIDSNLDDSVSSSDPTSSGHTVYIDANNNRQLDAGERSVISGMNGPGFYRFDDVGTGTFLLRIIPATGWYGTAPPALTRQVSISIVGDVINDIDFGVSQSPPRNYLTAAVFDDSNRNGVKDAGEVNLDGSYTSAGGNPIRVWVDLDNDGVLDASEYSQTMPGQPTAWMFVPSPGTYRLRVQPPRGWVATMATQQVTLAAGQRIFDIPVGVAVPVASGATLAGVAFNDADGDGLFGAGDSPNAARLIYQDLDDDWAQDATEPAVYTDSLGRFAFTNLAAGTYRLRQTLPAANYLQTTPVPAVDALTVTLAAGEQRQDLLFGSAPAAAHQRGRVRVEFFHDLNANGVREAGEGLYTDGTRPTFYLDQNNNGIQDTGDVTAFTSGGITQTTEVAQGRYRARLTSTVTGVRTSTPGTSAPLIFDMPGGQDLTMQVGLYHPPARLTSLGLVKDSPTVHRQNFLYADLFFTQTLIDAVTVSTLAGQPVATSLVAASSGTLRISFPNLLASGDYRVRVAGSALAGSSGLPVPADYVHDFMVVSSGATVALPQDETKRINELSIDTGGKLDIGSSQLVINYDGFTPSGASNGVAYTGIHSQIATGRAGGAWTGSGIITSMSDAKSPTLLTTVGVAEASQALGLSGVATALWEGQTVDATSVLMKYTFAGDLNLDGRIDADDYFWIDRAYAKKLALGYGNGDINYDAKINGDDYFLIDLNYQRGLEAATTAEPFWHAPTAVFSTNAIAVIDLLRDGASEELIAV